MMILIAILLLSINNHNPFVEINGVQVQKYLVSWSDYKECLENKSCKMPDWAHEKWPPGAIAFLENDNERFPEKIIMSFKDRTVYFVDINTAVEYCEFAGGRLWTQKEFVHICSRGGTTNYPWGDEYESSRISTYLPLDSPNRAKDSRDLSFIQNVEGITQLLGDVWQITLSCYDEKGNYHEEGSSFCVKWILKGGRDPKTKKYNCQSKRVMTDKWENLPEVIGFRCVKEIVK